MFPLSNAVSKGEVASPRPVRILDDRVVNQIAAGEVVERPASVVKELIENAIDAGATEISVVLSNGGRSLIEVSDNGSGMSKEDLLLAIRRFGTSKIRTAEDLVGIASLGFRGEALPSIASVSQFSISTRAAAEQQGTELKIEGGEKALVYEAQRAPGTTVKVQNLFYNVPARRSFLRGVSTETAAVKVIVQDFALAYPTIGLLLVSDGKEVFRVRRANSETDRWAGLEVAGQSPINLRSGRGEKQFNEDPSGSFEIRGQLSAPIDALVSANRLRLVVNGRVVRDKLLLRAIRDGYGAYLKPGRYPVGIVVLTLPAEDVDVNVHPQKSEVRFRTPDLIYKLLRNCIATALAALDPVKLGAPTVAGWGFRGRTPQVDSSSSVAQRFGGLAPRQDRFDHLNNSAVFGLYPSDGGDSRRPTAEDLPPATTEEESLSVVQKFTALQKPLQKEIRLSELRFVGQVLNCYLVLEGEGAVFVVDMHAAHERITFFELKQRYLQARAGMAVQKGGAGGEGVGDSNTEAPPSQLLLVPEVLSLPPDAVAAWREVMPVLEGIGFEIDQFGPEQVIVRAVPTILSRSSVKEIFRDLQETPEWSSWGGVVEKHIDAVLTRIACHGSIRSGRKLEREEAYELIRRLEQVESSAFCPHGRPVVRALTRGELELMFGRVQ